MPTSKSSNRVFAWTWLPGAGEPVVAGAVERSGNRLDFNYAESYLARNDRISLYGPELPLMSGRIKPKGNLLLAGCLRDGTPDTWGRRVIEANLGVDVVSLREEDYMLHSGSNRFGALDFQASSSHYVPRTDHASLDELHEAATRLQTGQHLSPSMEAALIHGTSIGGARPKVLVDDSAGVSWIAKLSASSDQVFSVINAEGAAMELARRAGIETSHAEVFNSLGRDILLVRRFDRGPNGERHHVVSALTMAGEDEMGGRYVTYPDFLQTLRAHSPAQEVVGRQLFERIAFNIAVGNSDDHARNHAAFWDGKSLSLTPAYDLAPGARSGETSTQAMAFDPDGKVKSSNFHSLVRCSHHYDLSETEGREVIDNIVDSIHENWNDAADLARLTENDRKHLWGRQFLNPAALYGYFQPHHASKGSARSSDADGTSRKHRGVPGNGEEFAGQERPESTKPLIGPSE